MKAENKVLPPTVLLFKVIFIADLKELLPFSKKGLFNKAMGIFCERHNLPQGAFFYTAGGTVFRKLRFTWEHNGSITIQTYKPGDWEVAIDKAYEIAGSAGLTSKLDSAIRGDVDIVDIIELNKRLVESKETYDEMLDMVRQIPTLNDNDLLRLWKKWDKPETANTFQRAALLMELSKRGIVDYKIQGWQTSTVEVQTNSASLLPDRTLLKEWRYLEWEKERLPRSRDFWENKISRGEELKIGRTKVADSPEGIRKQLELWEREIEEKEKALKEEMMERGYMDANGLIYRKRRAPKESKGQG
jgi:hypothetical protein